MKHFVCKVVEREKNKSIIAKFKVVGRSKITKMLICMREVKDLIKAIELSKFTNLKLCEDITALCRNRKCEDT